MHAALKFSFSTFLSEILGTHALERKHFLLCFVHIAFALFLLLPLNNGELCLDWSYGNDITVSFALFFYLPLVFCSFPPPYFRISRMSGYGIKFNAFRAHYVLI